LRSLAGTLPKHPPLPPPRFGLRKTDAYAMRIRTNVARLKAFLMDPEIFVTTHQLGTVKSTMQQCAIRSIHI
jgi:hypothetical protein